MNAVQLKEEVSIQMSLVGHITIKAGTSSTSSTAVSNPSLFTHCSASRCGGAVYITRASTSTISLDAQLRRELASISPSQDHRLVSHSLPLPSSTKETQWILERVLNPNTF